MNKIFEKENNPHWWIDLCIEGKLFLDYHESLMREINRREGNYGRHQIQTNDDTLTEADKKKMKEEAEKKRLEESKQPYDPYKLEIPSYIRK